MNHARLFTQIVGIPCYSAKGAQYENQGQVLSEAKRVAPGSQPPKAKALKGRNPSMVSHAPLTPA